MIEVNLTVVKVTLLRIQTVRYIFYSLTPLKSNQCRKERHVKLYYFITSILSCCSITPFINRCFCSWSLDKKEPARNYQHIFCLIAHFLAIHNDSQSRNKSVRPIKLQRNKYVFQILNFATGGYQVSFTLITSCLRSHSTV